MAKMPSIYETHGMFLSRPAPAAEAFAQALKQKVTEIGEIPDKNSKERRSLLDEWFKVSEEGMSGNTLLNAAYEEAAAGSPSVFPPRPEWEPNLGTIISRTRNHEAKELIKKVIERDIPSWQDADYLKEEHAREQREREDKTYWPNNPFP